ncbi:hypothetical protein DPMN_050601, partial [Dreissena polymorpha]
MLHIVFVIFLLFNAEGLAQTNVTQSSLAPAATSDLVAIHQEVSNATGGTGLYLFTLRINKPLDVDTQNEAFTAGRQFEGTVTAVIPLIVRNWRVVSPHHENAYPETCIPSQKIMYASRNQTTDIALLFFNSVCTGVDGQLRTVLEVSPFFLQTMVPCDVTIVARDGTYKQQIFAQIIQENNFSSITLQLRHKECPADTDAMGTHWFSGRIGFIEGMSCPSNTYGNVTRYCDMDGLYRDPVYNCTRTSILDIYTK